MPEPKPVTIGRLPRVFVAILARDQEDLLVLIDGIRKTVAAYVAPDLSPDPRTNLAQQFNAILGMPKVARESFAKELDHALDMLLEEDAFGTEGQNDPRGDHRE